jgi:hypothetical protein
LDFDRYSRRFLLGIHLADHEEMMNVEAFDPAKAQVLKHKKGCNKLFKDYFLYSVRMTED